MAQDNLRALFDEHGYAVARGLFSQEEAAHYRDHYMRLRAEGVYPGDFAGIDPTSADPLRRYPRMIHMHRWDDVSLRWLLEPRIAEHLALLVGREPIAVQTMLYFKPPGARGQAMHQDQHYLRVQPGTCMAAWLALDVCDDENGCLRVAPGTQRLPVLCTRPADTQLSFTDVTVPLPPGQVTESIHMQPGDVLFFNGQLIHGSFPNVTTDRFRRSLIGHYIAADAHKVAKFYHPALRMDGSVVELATSKMGGPCGVFRETDGETRVEMAVMEKAAAGPTHE